MVNSVAMVTPWKVRCGIFSYSEKLVQALAELGIDVYIVRLPRFGAKTKEILEGVITKIPMDKVDIIHIQHEYGLYQNLEGGFYGTLNAIARHYNKPIITTMHAVGNWEVDKVISHVIVHNEFCARMFKRPSIIIPHGLHPTRTVDKGEAKKSYGLVPEAPTVGYLGFISNYKGLEQLITAMTGVKAGLIIGGGWHVSAETEYMYNLKAASLNMLPGKVKWLGWVPEEKLATAYGAMDLIVYPSRFATESGSLLNAISHGKAVLASRIAPFIEKEKKGILITFKNDVDLRRKIKKLLKNETLRKDLETKAWEYAEENSWEHVAELHSSLYDHAIKDLDTKK